MTSTAGGVVKPELIKSEHIMGYYDPIAEEDTDDEEATKVIEEIKARSHLEKEGKLYQSAEVNAKIEKVNVKDEDTDDEFSKLWISYYCCSIHNVTASYHTSQHYCNSTQSFTV